MSNRVLPLLSIFLAIGILFAYVRPLWSGQIAETKIEIENNERTLLAAKEYAAKQNELASARNAIDPANLSRLEIFLPDSVNNVGLILDINALAARSGLSLSNIDIVNAPTSADAAVAIDGTGSISGASPVSSVDLSLSAVGTYTGLQAFLKGLEKSARLLDVRDIVVRGSETGVYSYQMVVRLYWLR
jgi:Tfp pilus assembly protein PilO